MKLSGSQFLQKNFIAPSRNCFSGYWKSVFFIYQIFQAVKTAFHKGNIFLTNSSFLIMETNYLPSRNSIVLFRALLKFLKFEGSSIFKRKPYFCSWKLIFWLVETIFLHFLNTPTIETYFLSSGNVFLNIFFMLMMETDFLSCGSCFVF